MCDPRKWISLAVFPLWIFLSACATFPPGKSETQQMSLNSPAERATPSAHPPDAALLAELPPEIASLANRISVWPKLPLEKNAWAIVKVGVGNVRFKPDHRSELGTQLLMGTKVRVLKTENAWTFVQTSEPYAGWIESSALIPSDPARNHAWESGPLLIVTNNYDHVLRKPESSALPVCDCVAGALFRKIGQEGDWFAVELPDGQHGYLPRSTAADWEDWKKARQATAAGLEQSARRFFGVPYLWGGATTKGFDCSGFTRTVFFLNGIDLKRDARQQATQGQPAEPGKSFENLQPGDLVFFGRKATPHRPQDITHVGIYLGDQNYIHCAGSVQMNSFDPKSPLFEESRLKTFLSARRLLGDPASQ